MSKDSLRVTFSQISPLRAWLSEHGFVFEEAPHAYFRARGPEATITIFRSGKVLAQGKAGPDWFDDALKALAKAKAGDPKPALRLSLGGEPQPDLASTTSEPDDSDIIELPRRFRSAIAKLPDPSISDWIGIDEAGKGDYFGPLVIAAAHVERGQLPLLAELGVGDSKAINDKEVRSIAASLKPLIAHEIMVLRPPKYNELYDDIGNLNHLLAWAHSVVGSKVAEETGARLILSDQFAKRDIITPRLRKRGYTGSFIQRTKAEEDPSVGAASIFARATFLWEMSRLEREHGVKLHKGAGPPVLSAGRTIVKKEGPEFLKNVAKLHFKTTARLTG